VTLQTNAFGEEGERVAGQWLERRGWSILDRRFRNGHRDVDLIAARDRTTSRGPQRLVAFVEVKARKEASFGGPFGAINWRKQRELRRSANIWISRYGQPGDEYRFDVVGVVFGTAGPSVDHIENAFQVPTRS
jgi:putative endonuclease